jgi:hypothetical protein
MARTVERKSGDGQTAGAKAPTRNPGLKALDKLVGTWKVSGETQGELSYEWMEGGFFLVARGNTEQGGQRTQHVEIIGYDRALGAEPSDVMTSRLYTNRGDTLNYTHEVDDKGVTSWFGAKGSPTIFKARWIDDNTLTGAWEWLGGGYTLTLTRTKGQPSGKR